MSCRHTSVKQNTSPFNNNVCSCVCDSRLDLRSRSLIASDNVILPFLPIYMLGFDRLLTGPNKGGYYQEHFVRGQPSLCRQMKRLKIKGTRSKLASSPKYSTTSPPGSLREYSSIEANSAIKVVFPKRPPPRVVSQKDTSAGMLSQGKPWLQSSFDHHCQGPQSRRNALFPSQLLQSHVDSGDLFDEDTLLSVLSSDLDDPVTTITNKIPNEGDCLLFGGNAVLLR